MAWEPVMNITGPEGPPGEGGGGGGAIIISWYFPPDRVNLSDYVDVSKNPRARVTFTTNNFELWDQGVITLGEEYPFRIYTSPTSQAWEEDTMVRAEVGGKRNLARGKLFSFTLPIMRTDRFNSVVPPTFNYQTSGGAAALASYELIIEPL